MPRRALRAGDLDPDVELAWLMGAAGARPRSLWSADPFITAAPVLVLLCSWGVVGWVLLETTGAIVGAMLGLCAGLAIMVVVHRMQVG